MATTKRTNFETTEEGLWCKQVLQEMESDDAYYTEPSFTINTADYPDNKMPFVVTHMNYLTRHPEASSRNYISNLRLRTRKSS